MKTLYRSDFKRRIAKFFLLTSVIQIIQPAAAWALTSGPTQPEFSGFQPVAARDMVDKFTGDFTYALPLMEVPGPMGSSYPLTLAYHSGANVEEDASWVGLGWSLSPGAINRNARGIPDDFNGESVTHYNKTPNNYTFSTSKSTSTELFSRDNYATSLSASKATHFNRNTGFGFDQGIGITLGKGLVSLGRNEDQTGQYSYSARINPMALLSYSKEPGEYGKPEKKNFNWKDWSKNAVSHQLSRLTPALQLNMLGGNRGFFDFNEAHRSTQATSYTGHSYDIRFGVTVNTYLPIGVSSNVSASYTYQNPTDQLGLQEYGYLYSAEAKKQRETSKDVLMDYYTEKDAPYSPRSTFVGMPFHNADIYNVSGEGLGGMFQLHHPKIGEFVPNKVENETGTTNLGFDVDLVAWGAGASYGTGKHRMTEDGWNEAKGLLSFSSSTDQNAPYFRFTNDLGGTVGNDLDDAPVTAAVERTTLSLENATLRKNGVQNAAERASFKRSGQGSHIGYHTKREATSPLLSYCKRSAILSLRNASAASAHSIAEFQVVNEAGQQYTYGLPVYARQERRMQYGMESLTAANLEEGFIAFSGDSTVKVGEKQGPAYATNYLLTEINSPDYVDRTFDGPSPDDFGGYVKFDYARSHGGNNAWYHWRTPYLGHYFEPNSLSSKTDDIGSFVEGDKEIYYLSTIRTKTHTAIFELVERQDGFDALGGDDARTARAITDKSARKSLQLLKAIKLYTNADFDDARTPLSQKVPIKKIVFDYTYELCGNTPNAWSVTIAGESPNQGRGKLTLKKIHTFYNNIEQGQPYEFVYKYPDYDTYPAKYQSFRSGYEFPVVNGQDPQNPNYDKFSLDAWGNAQFQGNQRARNQQTWPSQRKLTDSEASQFDPAAWQLKVIKLPTGGEIHVQYEQDDYLYVQNQQAMGLASLIPETSNNRFDRFLVDPASVGINSDDVDACIKMINDSIRLPKRKMHFRFLYNLYGGIKDSLPKADGTEPNSEYITGYVSLKDVEKVVINNTPTIRLTVGETKNGNGADVVVSTTAELLNLVKNYTLPRQVCWDFAMTQRLGILQKDGQPPYIGVDVSPNSSDTDAKNKLSQYVSWALSGKFQDISKDRTNYCTKLNYGYSYFKIPLPRGKKGGGLRVKRLLTFEPNNLGDGPLLYGSEYIYKQQTSDGNTALTSGVATNEPASMRAENALVTYIPGLKQSLFSKIISGVDQQQTEGPIGESQLPGASVGYSRVVIKNIHSGETNPGFSVTEYHTCREYPVKTVMTTLDLKRFFTPFYFGLYNRVTDKMWLAQGFSIILNSMHGQLKREATYAGYYREASTLLDNVLSLKGAALVTEQAYTYFTPSSNDKIRLMAEPEEPVRNADNSVSYRKGQEVSALHMPGKEIDLTMAQRSVRERAQTLDFEADLTYSPAFIVTPAVGGSYTDIVTEYASHATTKVVRYPAIVQRIRTMHDNITETVENLAFDVYTGQPVARRTSDSGLGGYVKQDVMGSWLYPQLGSRALEENRVMTVNCQFKLLDDAFYLEPDVNSNCDLLAQIQPGDVLQLGDDASDVFYADAPSLSQKRIRLYPVVKQDAQQYTTAQRNASFTKVRVVFSGRTNQLQTGAGSTTYYGPNRTTMGLTSAPQFDSPTETDQLAIDLENKLRNLNAGSTTISFPLAGPYRNINLAGFQSSLSSQGIAALAEGNTVTDLRFIAFRDTQSGVLRLTLVSFKVNGKEIK